MGTEVLRSQDIIREAPASFHHRKTYHGYGNSGPKVNRKQVRPEHRRNSPAPRKSEMLGQLVILKRGEALGAKIKAGPDPKQVRLGVQDTYAGSAFSMSPSPSSLPLPTFFTKGGVKAVDDSAATRDLRRLLRLD
ncbi:hypothetical protein DCAR_0832437 [Daucus carota subsp. sativus]|uniref:Uncharacterized protein n=1 Tax=Daucus carota subsp. sativus TaxID=79200 RepID=A0A175YQQ7_DAUCS|nr:PREDICTED: uncharacterized protein LOC108198467 [Daucus carota subsp. sativus]WOH12928.1 hypothetical protein DCAR_0832437 [Daucus carota subsp. sativus]